MTMMSSRRSRASAAILGLIVLSQPILVVAAEGETAASFRWSMTAGREVAATATTLDRGPTPTPETDAAKESGETLRLHWLGGLAVRSDDDEFGGFSGLAIAADGSRLLAVSDRGGLWSARLLYRDGRLSGIAESRMAALPLRSAPADAPKWRRDAEALALDADAGRIYVAFEGDHRIADFTFDAQGALRLQGEIRPTAAIRRKLGGNRGIEAMIAFGRDDRGPIFLAVAESAQVGWLIGADGAARAHLDPVGSAPYRAVDLTRLPDGDLLILERRFDLIRGFGARLRRLRFDGDGRLAVAAATRLDGALNAIDNMEGLAWHRNAEGDIVLTMISDDNFNLLQRTLILQFAVLP